MKRELIWNNRAMQKWPDAEVRYRGLTQVAISAWARVLRQEATGEAPTAQQMTAP
jgi:hypothetical protein